MNSKVTLKIVKNFLQKERTYTLFHPVRHRYRRLKVVPSGLNTDWQADLIDISNLVQHNDGYRYILNCIDSLSRMIYPVPAKTKKSSDMIVAFEKLFAKAKAKPWKLMTDKGVEFTAKPLTDYYDKKDLIKLVSLTNDEVKCVMVERANRTLLERLYRYFSEKNTLRWIDALDKIADAINKSIHSTIKMRPIDVTYDNAQKVRSKLLEGNVRVARTRFRVGDHVT